MYLYKKAGIFVLIMMISVSAFNQKLTHTAKELQARFPKEFKQNIVLPADRFEKDKDFSKEVNKQAEAIVAVAAFLDKAIVEQNYDRLEFISSLILEKAKFEMNVERYPLPGDRYNTVEAIKARYAYDIIRIVEQYPQKFHTLLEYTEKNAAGQELKVIENGYAENTRNERLDYITKFLITMVCDWATLIETYEIGLSNFNSSGYHPVFKSRVTEFYDINNYLFIENLVLPIGLKLGTYTIGEFAQAIDKQSESLIFVSYIYARMYSERSKSDDEQISDEFLDEFRSISQIIADLGNYESEFQEYGYDNSKEAMENRIWNVILGFSRDILRGSVQFKDNAPKHVPRYIADQLMTIDCDWRAVFREYNKAKRNKN